MNNKADICEHDLEYQGDLNLGRIRVPQWACTKCQAITYGHSSSDAKAALNKKGEVDD